MLFRVKPGYLILLLGLIMSSCHLGSGQSSSSKSQVEQASGQEAPTVYVMEAQSEEIFEPLIFAGVLQSVHHRVLLSSIAGTLAESYAQEGETIRRGQLLFAIQPDGLGLEYQRHKIFAPIAGVLSKSRIRIGDRVTQDQKLAEVDKLEQLETGIEAAHADLATLRKGLALEVVLAPDTPFEVKTSGRVTHLSPRADENTLTFRVLVAIDCTEASCLERARLGTLAKVMAKQDVRIGLKLPSRLLRDQQSKVLVVGDDGRATFLPVTTGRVYADELEIVTGLQSGQKIVTSFSRKPKEGEMVIIGVPDQAEPPGKEGEIARKEAQETSQS